MSRYAKAITAFITSGAGLFVAYGIMNEAQAQEVVVGLTAVVNLLGVYIIPNK